MPDFADELNKHSFLKKIMYKVYNNGLNKSLKEFAKYIFLTEQMNTLLNNKKPWMLMECIVDQSFHKNIEIEYDESKIPSVVYAGKIHEEFGMDILLKTIPLVKNNCTFDIYGDGNYVDNFEQLAQRDNRVKLHGIVPVEQVIRAETNSTVLINPRTSKGEFTQYSFPSKTAEYMMTGVPIVMFRLPGIPDEYTDFLIYAEDEDEYSLASSIMQVLNMNDNERSSIGEKAKSFIEINKSNVKQAKRFLNFIEQ